MREEKRATFMEKINQDCWHDDLWLELNDACNDSGDSGAVKDLNKLAMRWEIWMIGLKREQSRQ